MIRKRVFTPRSLSMHTAWLILAFAAGTAIAGPDRMLPPDSIKKLPGMALVGDIHPVFNDSADRDIAICAIRGGSGCQESGNTRFFYLKVAQSYKGEVRGAMAPGGHTGVDAGLAMANSPGMRKEVDGRIAELKRAKFLAYRSGSGMPKERRGEWIDRSMYIGGPGGAYRSVGHRTTKVSFKPDEAQAVINWAGESRDMDTIVYFRVGRRDAVFAYVTPYLIEYRANDGKDSIVLFTVGNKDGSGEIGAESQASITERGRTFLAKTADLKGGGLDDGLLGGTASPETTEQATINIPVGEVAKQVDDAVQGIFSGVRGAFGL